MSRILKVDETRQFSIDLDAAMQAVRELGVPKTHQCSIAKLFRMLDKGEWEEAKEFYEEHILKTSISRSKYWDCGPTALQDVLPVKARDVLEAAFMEAPFKPMLYEPVKIVTIKVTRIVDGI